MDQPLAVVLWEDSGDERNGPHALLVACVADRLGAARDAVLRRVGAIYQSGSGNLLRVCREDLTDLAATWNCVAAIFDHDRLHRLLPALPSDACKRQFVERIRTVAAEHPALRVVLLIDNMETVEDAAREVLALPSRGGRKRLNQRDIVLNGISRADKSKRDELLARVPFFKRLVDLLVELWKDAPRPA